MSPIDKKQINLIYKIPNKNNNSLRDFCTIVFRYKFQSISFLLCSFCLITAWTIFTSYIYQSDSEVLIKIGRENVAVDPAVSGPTLNVFQERENQVNTEFEIIKSRILAEKVVQEIGWEYFLSQDHYQPITNKDNNKIDRTINELETDEKTGFQNAVKYVLNHLEVSIEKKSNMISISFQSKNPHLSQNTLNTFLELYLDRHIEINKTQASPDFFQKEVHIIADNMLNKGLELNNFRKINNILYLDKQKQDVLGQIDLLQKQLDSTAININYSSKKIKTLEKILKDNPQFIESSKEIGEANFVSDNLKKLLIELQLIESDLQNRFQENYRPLINLREKIKLIKSALSNEDTSRTIKTISINDNYKDLKLSLEKEKANFYALEDKKSTIEEKLNERTKQAEKLVNIELTLKKMERDYNLIENEYIRKQENLNRAYTSTALDKNKISNVSIVQPATFPSEPIKPNKKLTILFGFLFGLYGGIGIAFTCNFFDKTLKTAQDIENYIGLPVLTSISDEEFKGYK